MTHYDDTMATTDDAGPPQLPREAPAPKPNSAMIFGILNLVFGIGGLLAALGGIAVLLLLDTVFADNEAFQEAMANQPPLWISGIHTAVWVVLGIWLIVSGIKLLKVAPGCRELFIKYCIVSLVARPIVIIVAVPFTLEAMRVQSESDPINPFAGETGETIMTAMIVGGAMFNVIWAVAYEIAGLIVMKHRKTIEGFAAYQHTR